MFPIVDPNRSHKKFGGDRSYANEMLEMDHMSAMHSFIEDEEVGDYREGIFRQNIPGRVADCSLIRNRRINPERIETDLHRNCDRLIESRAESRDLYLEDGRMPPNSVSFSRGGNTFSRPDSVVAPNFTRDGMMRSELVLDQFLLDRRYGVNMNDDSYEGYLVREKEKNRNDKVLMSDKVLGLNQKDDYVGFGSFCEKFRTPLDEQRFSYVDNQLKTSYNDRLNRSNTLSLPSAVDDYRYRRPTCAINEMDIGNVSSAGISPEYIALSSQLNHTSSECLNMFSDEQRFSYVDNQLKTSYNDRLNRSNTLSLPSAVDDYRYRRPTCAINELDIGNVSSAGISPEYNALSSQLNHTSSECLNMLFSDVLFSDCNRNHHTYDDIVRRSIPEPLGLHHGIGRSSSPMVVGQSASLVRDVNPYLSHRNIYSPRMETENRGYNSSECGSACIGSGKPRKSVFARLASSSSSRIQAKDTNTFDIDSSVDELMEILRQGKKFRLEKLERKTPAVQLQQHSEGEKEKKRTITSLDDCPGNSDFGSVPEKLLEESIKAVDGIVHETLTETRAVEFKRRREKNTCEKTQVCRDVKKENDKSAENAEQLDKEQPKRRKLVRPVFAVNN